MTVKSSLKTTYKTGKVAPLLAPQFPVGFSNGYKIDSLAFWCTECGQMAHPDQMRGYISKIVDQSVDITAGFSCHKCEKKLTYKIRIKDDKSISYYSTEYGWKHDDLSMSTAERIMLYARWLPKYIRLLASKYRLRYHYLIFKNNISKTRKP